jgi:hypothetical protein
MILEDAIRQVAACAAQMNELYGKVVFDEWAIISLLHSKARVLAYGGSRNDEFLQNFASDLGALRTSLLHDKYTVGDFEFTRHGVGTKFEAFLMAGKGLYLVCNNTHSSMSEIAKDPKWIQAQVPFAELSDKMRSDPLTVPL